MNASILYLMLFSLLQPSRHDDTPQFKSIKLSEFTRGTMRMIEVTPKQIIVVYNSERYTEAITPATWERAVKMAGELPLRNLESIPIVSKKHQVDAALHASLTFMMRDTSVFTPTFDHNAPPEAYQPLIDHLYQQVPAALKERFSH